MLSQFPNQRLTTAEKVAIYGSIEKWAQSVYTALEGISSPSVHHQNQEVYRKQVLYDLAAGQINEDDLQHVIKPFGEKVKLPAQFKHYDLIGPKLNLLCGEEIKKPFNFRAVQVNPDAVSAKEQEKKRELLTLFEQIAASDPTAPEQSPDDSLLEKIEKYYNYEYNDLRELLAQRSLSYLIPYCNLKYLFNKGYKDLLVTGQQIYWTGIISGEPACRLVNNLYCEWDQSPNMEFFDEDCSWFKEWRYMTAAQVYDEFYDQLSDDQVRKIEEMKGRDQGHRMAQTAGIPIVYDDVDRGYSSKTFDYESNTLLKVGRLEWKALRKVGIITYVDEKGRLQKDMVDESFTAPPHISVEWYWINEVWECTNILDFYVGCRPKPNQHNSLDNPSKCKLGYVGIVFNKRNSREYSMVEVMKAHQYLYDIVLYRVELLIAAAGGKGFVFDIAQLPTSEDFDIEKFLYYLKTFNIAFINSMEEGKGAFQGQRPNFNQFQTFDMTLSQSLIQYIQILDKLENMLSDLSGVSRQRQGDVSSSETVGGVERSVVQSSHITEPLNYAHNEVKRRVLTNLLDEAKLAWMDGKKATYVLDDLATLFLSIEPGLFADSEFGVFISNNSRDNEVFNTLKELAQAALQNDKIELLELFKVLRSDSMVEAEKNLERAIKRRQQELAQAQQAQAQENQEALQMQLGDKQADRDLKYLMNQENNEVKLLIAELGINSSQDEDTDNDGVPDQLEIEKLRIQREKMQMDASHKAKELKLKSRDLDIKEKGLRIKSKQKAVPK